MEAQVKFTLETTNDGFAQALYSTLKPDNRDFPKGLRIEMKVTNNRLVLIFVSRGDIETLISSVNEVFEHIGISLEALKKMVEDKC